jgi:hypothetical protein
MAIKTKSTLRSNFANKTGFNELRDLADSAYNFGDGLGLPFRFTSATTVTATAALANNSYNLINEEDPANFTLPAASTCTAGDIILVRYISIIGNSDVHKFGTSGEFFADTSVIFKATDAANSSVFDHDVANGTSHDFLNLTGATNAGPGKGTELLFVFNGTQWHVEGTIMSSGTGAGAAVTAAFATS